MKTMKILSLALFGFFLTGLVHAQEVNEEMLMMAEPTMMIEEDVMPPMDMMMRDGMEMDQMMRMHEEGGNKGWDDKGECPMKKMMKNGYHQGGWSIFFGLIHGVCMLVFLFLGAFVIRKGWKLAGCCCMGKACKK